MLGSGFLLIVLAAVPKPAPLVVDRLHVTGYAPFPRAHVGGIVPQPPTAKDLVQTGPLHRLHVTGYAPFPRAHVGGVPTDARKGVAASSPSSDLVYGLRSIKKARGLNDVYRDAPFVTGRVPPGVVITTPGTFPTQFFGFLVGNGTVGVNLCAVLETDYAPAMGAAWVFAGGTGTVYAAYLVETTDPNASAVRISTTTGIKSVRLKT
jgi:hypothetical protein